MNNKTTKRALLSSIVALILCFAMLLGTTYAWFTDTVVSGNNIIKTGNLDMKLSYKPYGATNTAWTEVTDSTVLFGKDALYEPGYTEAVWFKVENLGSLAFRYDLAVNISNEEAGTNKAGDEFKLSDYLVVNYMAATSTEFESTTCTTRESLLGYNWGSAVASFKNDIAVVQNGIVYSANDATKVGEDVAYALVVISMPTTVGNEANHNGTDIPEINFTLTALATQLAYENDSFDNQYDVDAKYPSTATSVLADNRTEPTAITAGEVTVEVPADAPAGDYKLIVDNTSVVVDENGNSVANFEIDLTRNGQSVNSDGKEYTITIFVAKGLNPDTLKIYHNGADISSSIISANPASGLVTFKTDSFSPFAVEYKLDCDIFVEQDPQTKIKTISVFTADGFEQLNNMMLDKSAGKNAVVKLGANIDMTGKTWTPVDSHADTAFYLSEFDGQGFTISNLTINGQAMFKRFAGFGDVTIKNVTFNNAVVNSTALNSSILTVQTYQNLLLDNVDIKNSSITGTYKVAPLVATVYDEKETSIVCTVKNCDISDTVVTSTQFDYFTCGMISFVYTTNNDYVEYENCSVTNVQLKSVGGGYDYHANIHYTSADTDDQINEHPEVKVTNVTFESID